MTQQQALSPLVEPMGTDFFAKSNVEFPGGSMSNTSGLIAAKTTKGLKCKDIPNSVVYISPHTHCSIQKALRATGLEECVLRTIEVDSNFSMRTGTMTSSNIILR